LIPRFKLIPFADVGQAASYMGQHFRSASYIAGGTDVVVQLRNGKLRKEYLVDISSIPGLRGIREGRGTSLGSLTTIQQIVESTLIARRFPALREAARLFAAWQVRNLATLGGNLCNASPAADMAPPLLVYDASVVAASAEGSRRIPISEFFVGPGVTSLKRGELVKEVVLPSPRGGSAFVKLGRRQASILAVASAAARLELRGGRIREARLALGSVAPTPLRARRAEDLLKGQKLDVELLRLASQEVRDEVRPISDVRASADYRKEMAAVLSLRALMKAAGRSGGAS